MKSLFFLALFLLSLFVSGEAVITCGTVANKAAACVTFATGRAPRPSPTCCSGLKQLAGSVKSVNDRKAICRCLKATAKNIVGLQDKYLRQIPAACHIKVGFPVSVNTNCETIH